MQRRRVVDTTTIKRWVQDLDARRSRKRHLKASLGERAISKQIDRVAQKAEDAV